MVSTPSAEVHALILGVAQDAGHPQAGCFKPCCQPAWEDPELGHWVASVALIDGRSGRRWLLDATPELPRQLRLLEQLFPRAEGQPLLDGIFLTHAHTGHYTGLMSLGREAMNTAQLPVFAMPRMQEFLRRNGPWSQLVSQGNLLLSDLDPEQPVVLGPDLQLQAFRVPHRDEYSETVGYRVQGPSRRLVWLPDIDHWGPGSVDLEALVRGSDWSFLDGTFFDRSELSRDIGEIPHPFIQHTMDRLQPLPAALRRRVHFIHLNHSNPALRDSPQRRALLQRGYSLCRRGDCFSLG